MEIIISEECIGCEACVELCPQVFAMASGGDMALVLTESCEDICVQEAIDICPVNAITRI